MKFQVVVFDDNLARAEEGSESGEYGAEGVARGCRPEVTLQVSPVFVGCGLCHQLCDDGQLVANKLPGSVEEHEVGHLSDRVLQLIGVDFQQLQGYRVLQCPTEPLGVDVAIHLQLRVLD